MKYFSQKVIAKVYLLFAALALVSFQSAAQTSQPATDATVAAIRQSFQKINTSVLTKQHFTIEESGCVDDGTIDYFFHNGIIVKIVEAGMIGDGSWTDEYYFENGKLIFGYEEMVGGPADSEETIIKYRYYIKDNHAIRQIVDKKTTHADDKATIAIERATKLYKAYKTKDFKGALCD